FNQNAVFMIAMQYTGVSRTLFGYYLKAGVNTFYSHDGLNADGRAHALAYAGTGQNAGCWWQCWEASPIVNYSGADFDDAVVFMESVNPTPVNSTTWGKLKARFPCSRPRAATSRSEGPGSAPGALRAFRARACRAGRR